MPSIYDIINPIHIRLATNLGWSAIYNDDYTLLTNKITHVLANTDMSICDKCNYILATLDVQNSVSPFEYTEIITHLNNILA